MTSEKRIPLEAIEIAAPCSMSWDEMSGDEQVRFCNQCDKNVYDLSALSREEAESLVERTEAKICVTFYKRSDGTVLTDNCPVGLRRIRDRVVRFRSIAAGFIAALFAAMPAFAKDLGNQREMGKIAQPPQQAQQQADSMRMTGAPVPQPQRTTGEAVAPNVTRPKLKASLYAQKILASNGEVFMSSQKHHMTGLLLSKNTTTHYEAKAEPHLEPAIWAKWYKDMGKGLFDSWSRRATVSGQQTVTLAINPDGTLTIVKLGTFERAQGSKQTDDDEHKEKAFATMITDTVSGAQRRTPFPPKLALVKQVEFEVTFARDDERFPRFQHESHDVSFWYDAKGSVHFRTDRTVSMQNVKSDTPMVSEPAEIRTLGRIAPKLLDH